MRQKKFDTLTSILIYLLFALTVLYPFGFAASSLLGCTFKLTNAAVYSCVIAILSICTMMLTISLKEGLKSKPARALITYTPLLSMINAILLIFDLEGFIAIGGRADISSLLFRHGADLWQTVGFEDNLTDAVRAVVIPGYIPRFLHYHIRKYVGKYSRENCRISKR